MVRVTKVRVKNFKSIGGEWAEFDLDSLQGLTLIKGKNGTGKTTIISALVFGLYGKNSDLKGISKTTLPTSELINDITNKDMQIQVELLSNGKSYKITRGLKPNVLEIEQDGKTLNKQSATKYDQDYIETYILNGIDYIMFSKIVYLSAKITSSPFLYQTPQQRREFIEELLDVRVLFEVGQLAKKRRNASRVEIKNIEALVESKRQSMKELAAILKKQKEDNDNREKINKAEIEKKERQIVEEMQAIDVGKESIKKYEDKLTTIQSGIDKLDVWIEANPPPTDDITETEKLILETETDIRDMKTQIRINEGRIETEKKSREKYHICGDCPTVTELAGSFDFEDADNTIIQLSNDVKNQEETLKVYHDKAKALNAKQERFKEVKHKKDYLEDEKRVTESNIRACVYTERLARVEELKQDIEDIKNRDINNTTIDLTTLKGWKSELEALTTQNDKLENDVEKYDTIHQVVTSDEVKKSMYDIYIPLLRQNISKFIELFTQQDYASFTLKVNDNFEIELFKNGQPFNIFSLSEGQKGSINLAVTFSFQKLVEFKNQISLLLIDEILDMSFDEERLDSIIMALKEMSSNKPIMIISHNKDINESLFDNVISVSTKDGFSQYKTS